MVERRIPEQKVGGSTLTQVAVLYPSARCIYLPKSTGNTQEAVAPSRHDYKINDWDVKPQPTQTNKYKGILQFTTVSNMKTGTHNPLGLLKMRGN